MEWSHGVESWSGVMEWSLEANFGVDLVVFTQSKPGHSLQNTKIIQVWV